MKKNYLIMLLLAATVTIKAQNTPVSQMENLGRGVVAVPVPASSSSKGWLVTWRQLGTDDMSKTTFDVLRNGETIAEDLKVTNYNDQYGLLTDKYQIVTKVDGEVVSTTDPVKPWGDVCLKLLLDRPVAGAANGGTYSPNDCSVGDVDGDGEYEIFVKWDPSTSKDNSQGGITDNVYIDCYKLNGKKLWRIDLGRNIRAGAHYTQFQVYDYDGDGKAEMICKTAPGSLDGTGEYVNQATDNATIKAADNTKDWAAAGGGRINGGHEYLTVFKGLTGKAINTIAYNPNRNTSSALSEASGTFNWGVEGKNDTGSYGNRGERYLAATAYLDGPEGNASAIFCRGYYDYAFIWAVSFDGEKLIPRWLSSHKDANSYSLTTYSADGTSTTKSYSNKKPTSGSGSGTMYQNGNHNMSIGDVDGDGCDEIIWGSAALDNDGTLLYGTGYGHGDAIHMGRMIAGREGMQVFQVHEGGSYGWDLHDAATGEIIYSATGNSDNGRSMAAQVSSKTYDWWFSSANDRQQRSAATNAVASTASGTTNFRMYWDGTTQDALLDGNKLDKYSDSSNGFTRIVNFYDLGPGSTCNGSKNTPNLCADIFGDWREELVLYSVNDAETCLGIYSTNIETKYAVPTLMHDHTYRMAICWQNTAYNQPPHLGYNLAYETRPHFEEEALETNAVLGEEFTLVAQAKNVSTIALRKSVTPSGVSKTSGVPTGFTRNIKNTEQTITIKGTPTEVGDYTFTVVLTGYSGKTETVTLTVHVSEADGIYQAQQQTAPVKTTVCDMLGRTLPVQSVEGLPRGIYMVREETSNGVVTRKITVE
ncbi:MAG: rhamnogalacturonan lyase [Prevotella sp.]|nr:rhamnogalacturonan lyase [Prevotella sp.]